MKDRMQGLQVVKFSPSPIGVGLALLLAMLLSVATPHSVHAQTTATDGNTVSPTLRERIREKLLRRQCGDAGRH
jgi:hypothetical protein